MWQTAFLVKIAPNPIVTLAPIRTIVCLLGPSNGGKTTLLRTMRSCLAQEAYGYSPGHVSSFNLVEVLEREFNEGLQDTDRRIIKRAAGGRYASEESQFHAREAQIDHWGQEVSSRAGDGPADYFFSLEWTPGPLSFPDFVPDPPEPVLMQIVDAAGDLSTWSRPPSDDWAQQLDDLESRLRVMDAAIIVVPLDSHGTDLWAAHLCELIEQLVRIPGEQKVLKRLLVVFNKYEHLFTRFGTEAVSIALRPHAALYTVRREFQHRRWLQRLSQLARGGEIDLRFTVASSLGFTRLFGTPNTDVDATKSSSGPKRFLVKMGSTGEFAAEPLWRPFLTADPFIFAATGLVNSYMFTVQDLERDETFEDEAPQDEEPEPEREMVPPAPQNPPQPSALTRATRGTLGALKRFFNASSD